MARDDVRWAKELAAKQSILVKIVATPPYKEFKGAKVSQALLTKFCQLQDLHEFKRYLCNKYLYNFLCFSNYTF